MADGGGYGPDFLSRSMFFREAEAGPSQQELATMTAPFQGSPEQARALYQSPEVQARLQHFGLGGFSPDMILQSPFLPNQFMQQHPMLGGMLNRGMANVAATPEAPLVSGAGSGMTRAMQGAYGGPELLRQYQVRQLMAPFQAMGMQLPIMAEQRRQELLQALEQDMRERRGMGLEAAEQKSREAAMKQEMAKPIFDPLGRAWLPQQAQPASLGGAIQPHTPLDALIAPQLFSGQGGFQAQHPATGPGYQLAPSEMQPTPEQQAQYTQAMHPERVGAGALSGARAEEQIQETAGGMAPAKVGAEQALAEQRRGSAAYSNARAGWQKFINQFEAAHGGLKPSDYEKYSRDYNKLEQDTTKQIQALERASTLDPSAPGYVRPDLAQSQIGELNRLREQAKVTMDRGRGAAASPQAGSVPYVSPGAPPPSKPGAQPGRGARAGGAGSQQSQGTAVAPGTAGLPQGYVFNEQGIPVPAAPAPAPQP